MEYNVEQLYRVIQNESSRESIWADIQKLNNWIRYSGTPDGEASAEYIRDRLLSYGIPVEWVQYPCYRSIPGDATLTVGDKSFELMPYVFSGECYNMECELAFDEASEAKECPQVGMEKRLEPLIGKIALTYDNSYDFANAAAKAGVKGLIHIWPFDLAHHGSIGGVWGTPGPMDLDKYPFIPFAEITHANGDWVKQQIIAGTTKGRLSIKMDNGILKSSMPIAFVQGQSDDFVLVSGHYDGWHEGITDNACSNASMIELARVFYEHRSELKRSVMFAWWSGHSDGKYAGSTYYFDTHFEKLYDHCVAHVNMDIAGCMTSDLVALNTGGLEGYDNAMNWMEEFNELPPQPPIPMDRFADQTFWGANVPFAIMPRFNKRSLGNGIFYWWHTREDTLDKVDMNVMMRDHCVIGKLTAIFANSDRLPFDFDCFLNSFEARLDEIKSGLTADFDLSDVYDVLPSVKNCAKRLFAAYQNNSILEPAAIAFAGELTRLMYTSSSPYEQGPANCKWQLPGLGRPVGKSPDNCTEVYYSALRSEFLRQKNRVVHRLKTAVNTCERELVLQDR